MAINDPEPWWSQQDTDTAWIAQQEAIRAAGVPAGTAPVVARNGRLAAAIGKAFPLQVCRSAAGHYIGTRDDQGLPCSRESVEYWRQAKDAADALDRGQWTQRPTP